MLFFSKNKFQRHECKYYISRQSRHSSKNMFLDKDRKQTMSNNIYVEKQQKTNIFFWKQLRRQNMFLKETYIQGKNNALNGTHYRLFVMLRKRTRDISITVAYTLIQFTDQQHIFFFQIEIKRLPYPHGDCTNGENKNYLMNNRYNYSILSCQKKCFLDKMARECNCVMNSYDDYEGIPMCDRTHSEYSLMLQPNTDSSD